MLANRANPTVSRRKVFTKHIFAAYSLSKAAHPDADSGSDADSASAAESKSKDEEELSVAADSKKDDTTEKSTDAETDSETGSDSDASESDSESREPLSKIKVVVVGKPTTGCTSMLIRHLTGAFPDEFVPTVFDQYEKAVTVDDRTVAVSMWDTAGTIVVAPCKFCCLIRTFFSRFCCVVTRWG
jgi:hypothetical protein